MAIACSVGKKITNYDDSLLGDKLCCPHHFPCSSASKYTITSTECYNMFQVGGLYWADFVSSPGPQLHVFCKTLEGSLKRSIPNFQETGGWNLWRNPPITILIWLCSRETSCDVVQKIKIHYQAHWSLPIQSHPLCTNNSYEKGTFNWRVGQS